MNIASNIYSKELTLLKVLLNMSKTQKENYLLDQIVLKVEY